MTNQRPSGTILGLRIPVFLVLSLFLGIGAFFVITEHTAHLYGALPYLFLLACAGMHLFMHRGHGDHGSHGGEHDHAGHQREEDKR